MPWLSKAVWGAETDQICEGWVKQGKVCTVKAEQGTERTCDGNAEHRKGRVMKRKARALIGLVKALIRHAKEWQSTSW